MAARYDSPRDLLDDQDLIVFRTALPPRDRNTPLSELHPADTFAGLRKVVLQKLQVADFDAARGAARLFNNIIESALEGVDSRDPRSHIWLQTSAEFAPWFVDRLIAAVEGRVGHRGPFEIWLGEQFGSLKPLLEGFQRLFQRGGWPHDDLALGRFLLIVDHFKTVVETGWVTPAN